MIYVWSHHVFFAIMSLIEALWTVVCLPLSLVLRSSEDRELKVDWTFGGTWPYKPCYFDTPDGRIHYVDEGPADGTPIVMLHGNPTWGYLYRKFISSFSAKGYRCIVPDHLGYGRSDKPNHPEFYRYERHCQRLESLLISLDVRDAVLVFQDWGGPIGISFAANHRDRVKSLIVMNTLCQATRSPLNLHGFLRLVRTPLIGEFLVQGLNRTIETFLFFKGVARPENLTFIEKEAYRSPFKRWRDRVGMVQFPRQISALSSDPVSRQLGKYEKVLKQFQAEDVLIIWPSSDPGFTMKLLDEYWKTDFPRSLVVKVDRCGHYMQEDAPDVAIAAITQFLSKRG